jgi:acetyltransferase-like isoleucine patch superfamily enzyme
MSLYILLDGGYSMPGNDTVGQRLSLAIGRMLALRHRKAVRVGRNTRLSPEARVHPRKGRIVMGDDCMISPGAIVQGNVRMGHHCSVQAYSVVVGYGGPDETDGFVTMGDHVRIAPHVTMLAADHRFDDASRPISGQGHVLKPIRIGNDVWIAAGARITAGVTIGDGSVIGAGAVVTRDIPRYSVAAGVPARVLRRRGEPPQSDAT